MGGGEGGGGAFMIVLAPSEKGSTLKVKNLLPRGAVSSLFRVDSFIQDACCAGKQKESHKKYPPNPLEKIVKNLSCIKSPQYSSR